MPRRRTSLPSPAMGLDAFQTALKSVEMLSAAALTIGLRTSAWTPHDTVENTRMVTEKLAAAGEFASAATKSMLALQSESFRLWTDGFGAWSRMATLGWSGYGRMLAPYHKRTTANARRLSRKGG